MSEVLQITKMVLSPKQRAFFVNRNYETHLLKCVRNDFIQKFSNSVSLSNHAKLNLIKKFENKWTLDDLPSHSG